MVVMYVEGEEGERPCGGGSLWAWACDACQCQASIDPYIVPAVRFSVYPSGRTFCPIYGGSLNIDLILDSKRSVKEIHVDRLLRL